MASIHQPFSMVSKMTEQTKKQNNKKYKYTKQIIKLAIDNGFKHPEIAKKAGLSEKSIAQVSRWKNGEALATERQMQFFINEFEHSLKRKMEHLFYSETETPNELAYYKIQGEILLSHTLYYRHNTGKKIQKVGIYRFVIINSDNKFHLLFQKRAGLNENAGIIKYALSSATFSNNEHANWYLKETYKDLTAQELTHQIDLIFDEFEKIEYLRSDMAKIMNNDGRPLKFIVRQLLLKHGYCSDDIIDL